MAEHGGHTLSCEEVHNSEGLVGAGSGYVTTRWVQVNLDERTIVTHRSLVALLLFTIFYIVYPRINDFHCKMLLHLSKAINPQGIIYEHFICWKNGNFHKLHINLTEKLILIWDYYAINHQLAVIKILQINFTKKRSHMNYLSRTTDILHSFSPQLHKLPLRKVDQFPHLTFLSWQAVATNLCVESISIS